MFRDLVSILGSLPRLKALTCLVRRPGEWISASDVAVVIGCSRAIAQKELNGLVRRGVLKKRHVPHALVYTANERSLLFESLATFLAEATVLADATIAGVFRPVRSVVLVVTSGLLEREPKSSVDLLIVSKHLRSKGIRQAVRKVERLAAIPLRFAVLSVSEYQERQQAYDRLLRDVFEYRHRIVLERSLGAGEGF